MKKPNVLNMTTVVLLVLLFSACMQNDDTSETSIALPTNEIVSCDCSIEQYSDEPGMIEVLGDGVMTVSNYDGIRVFEGDIVLTDEQILRLSAQEQGTGGRISSAGQSNPALRWPGRVVPYVINSSLPNQSRVTSAISHWEANTSFDFVPRTNQSNYIEFVPSNGCASHVGMIGGRQYVYLASGCSTGNTIHELGHAVGLWHEHTRADRDYDVNILWDNINPSAVHNFDLFNLSSPGFDRGNFDFGSIMMYSSTAFSTNNLPTITKKDGSTFTVQRSALSSGDITGAQYINSAVNLPSPTNLYAYHDGDEELTVTWDAVSGADEYWIYTGATASGVDIQPYLYRIRTGTSWTRELKLKYRGQYRIWIAARDNAGNTSQALEVDYSWK